MKHEIFNGYCDIACKLFEVTKEELFTKTKRREVVDARYLLYYLCYQRAISVGYIERYMRDNGYVINHPTIIHGIKVMTDKVIEDQDYEKKVRQILTSI
jgi:chromosomal replication initiation ATPase DnaA